MGPAPICLKISARTAKRETCQTIPNSFLIGQYLSVKLHPLLLKGQCHEIFCFRFFSWITFPQAPENNSRVIYNFFWKFEEIFAGQGAPPVSTTPLANLPPVLMTPVANCRRYQRHRQQICHRYQQHRRQILPPVPLVLLTPVANNGNNIRLQTPSSEHEGKNLYILVC